MRSVVEDDTSDHRRALFDLLLSSTLLAVTPDVARLPGAPEGQSSLTTLESEDGPVLPVFTNVEAIRAWRQTGYRPVALPGRTLFQTAARYKTAKVEVNPGSVPRGWISRAEIEALAQGRIPVGPVRQRTEPIRDKVQRPAVRPPEALIEAARRALQSHPETVAAWLFAMLVGDGPAQLTVGVELVGGLDEAASCAAIQRIVEETWARSSDAEQLKFIPVNNALREMLVSGAGEVIFERPLY